MLDKMGQEITPGCIIAYGHALGRCAALRIGKVLKVETRTEKNRYVPELDKQVHRITVIGVDDDGVPHWGPRLLSKKSTLQFPNRCIVLSLDTVRPDIKALLESVQPDRQ